MTTTTPDDRLAQTSRLVQIMRRPELGAFMGALVIYLLFVSVDRTGKFGGLIGAANWSDTAANYGIVAVAVALLMIAGEFDLSSGVMVGTAGLLGGLLITEWGVPVWPAIGIVLVFALFIGFVNGYLVVRTGLPSFIVTLAMFFSLRGINLGVTKALTGTVRVIAARLNYLPRDAADSWKVMQNSDRAFISRYALGRDYHKVMRRRLQRFAERIEAAAGACSHRVFTDSAPVMEVEIARKAGLGWRGKHTLLLTRDAGSMFFLGEIYTDLPLPIDEPVSSHCGECSACIDLCPTGAIVGPYRLDARRCISYLTIELKDSIPVELRPLMGNRILGCDDCQLVCPWNKFAGTAQVSDFEVRNGLDGASLVMLFGWSEEAFARRLEGSPIRRIGHERWLRNLAVGLGNAPTAGPVVQALQARLDDPSALVDRDRHAGRAGGIGGRQCGHLIGGQAEPVEDHVQRQHQQRRGEHLDDEERGQPGLAAGEPEPGQQIQNDAVIVAGV